MLLTLGLCNVFKFNLFSFKPLKRNEVALIIISFLVIEITTYLLTTFFPIPNNQESLDNLVDHSNLIIAIITLGILIPIIEECICRGIFIKVLFQKATYRRNNFYTFIYFCSWSHKHNRLYNLWTSSSYLLSDLL